MKGQPGSAHDPVSGTEAHVLWRRVAPDICVVMGAKPTTAIHLLRRGPTVFLHAGKMGKERFRALGKIGHKRRPVVHFRIDVNGKLTSPWWCKILIPDALKIQWQRSRAGTGDHKISSELEKPYDIFLIIDLKLYTMEKFLIILDMLIQKLFPGFFARIAC